MKFLGIVSLPPLETMVALKILALFHEMLKSKIRPDHVTFLAIISVCGHADEVKDGIQCFKLMAEEFGIPARMEHYTCMVDLYGRAGRLNKAFKTIKSMSCSPDAGTEFDEGKKGSEIPGYSWIEVNNTTHMFVAADDSHPQSKHIYSLLKMILLELKRKGYIPQHYRLMHSQSIVS
ncbi:hypothetical protein DITRI_Ditri19aG0199900 [Diplodiscus trichospermus]